MDSIPKVKFDQQTNNGVEGFEIGDLKKLINFTEIPEDHNPFDFHRLNFFALLFVTSGTVTHRVDFESSELKSGDLLIISSGQVHAFDPNSGYDGYIVLFTESFMHKYMAASSLLHINHIYDYFLGINQFHYPELANQFLTEVTNPGSENSAIGKSCIIGSSLTKFLIKLGEHKMGEKNQSNNRSAQLFEAFRKKLQENYTKTRDARDYADKLCVSYKQLNTACKELIKDTAKSFIDSFIILEAKRLIVTTALSSKEISFQLGFDEPTNFLKYFKKHTNQTPSDFRKAN